MRPTKVVVMSCTQYVEVLGAGPADPGLLGGNGASLCRLVSLGHRVPPGFVIARDAFQCAIEDMGLSSALDTLDSLLAGTQDTTASAEQFVRAFSRAGFPRESSRHDAPGQQLQYRPLGSQ